MLEVREELVEAERQRKIISGLGGCEGVGEVLGVIEARGGLIEKGLRGRSRLLRSSQGRLGPPMVVTSGGGRPAAKKTESQVGYGKRGGCWGWKESDVSGWNKWRMTGRGKALPAAAEACQQSWENGRQGRTWKKSEGKVRARALSAEWRGRTHWSPPS